jgi:hypothetical protein
LTRQVEIVENELVRISEKPKYFPKGEKMAKKKKATKKKATKKATKKKGARKKK